MNNANDELHRTHAVRLCDLKGASLSVLLALALYGEQGRPDLIKRTGWSRFAVSGALSDLTQMGLVQRVHFRGWSLRQGLNLGRLFGRDPLGQTPEGPMYDLSEGAAMSSDAGCERTPQSLWDADVSPDGLLAETLSDDLSASERHSDDPSASERHSDDLSASERHSDVPSAPERHSDDRSGHDDHDLMNQLHESDHDDQSSEQTSDAIDMQQLLDDLQQLHPPFDHAQSWLQQTSPSLVRAWLDHLLDMDPQRRRRIRNEAAFLHAKVAGGEPPPPPMDRRAGRGAHRRRYRRPSPCPHCGKALRDAYGRCLVCAGVVMV